MSALFRATKTAHFDRLYRQHAASVYRYAFAVLGNRADAEDVAQQTFLKAYSAIAQGTKPRKAENWLLTIAHNEVRRHLRNGQARALEVELDERLEQPEPERTEPSLADVFRALQHLPPAQRSAIVMREFEGRSYAEMARILGVSQSALESLIFRARRSLAEHFEEALTCAEAEEAVSRRLDGRLSRREARRLKRHLGECPLCARFASVQKRQRSLLDGLPLMPVPASLFLFRSEQAAAAAGLGVGGAAGGGSAAVGGGMAAGFVAKAAAVAAAASVAGGVGYSVATGPPPRAAKVERAQVVASAPLVARTLPVRLVGSAVPARIGAVRARVRTVRRGGGVPAVAHTQQKAHQTKAPRSAKTVAPGLHRARGKTRQVVKTRPLRRAAAKPVAAAPARTRRDAGKKVGLNRPRPTKPPRPAHLPQKANPANPSPQPSPHAKPAPAAKDTGRGMKEETPGVA
jgi:RNA polymerase sigma-70 factor, ECF subfamily